MLVALLLASFLINLDTTLVNVALPTLSRELEASNTQLQWVVDAYNLVFAALLLTSGSLSDRFGRTGMLMAGLLVFGAASFTGGFAGSSAQLIAARAVMGLGAAMVFPATLALLTATFTSRKDRALAIGLWGATAGIAIALGPIVGGFLLEHYSWSSIFYVLGPVAAVVVVLVALCVPEARKLVPRPLDPAGLGLSSGFMGLLVYTIIEAPNRGWASPASLGGFAGALVLLIAFLSAERRALEPMLDVRLFKDMRFSAASASVTIAYFTLLGIIFLITQYFQFVRGYSPLSAGVHLLPVAVSVAVGSTIGTRLAVRVGTKLVVTAGLALQALFYFWFASDVSPTLDYEVIAVQMVFYGLGMGLTSAPATESIMGAVAADQAGVGSAVNDSTRLLGGTLGVAVIGSIYATLYSSRLDDALPAWLSPQLASLAHQSVGAASEVSGHFAAQGRPILAEAVRHSTIGAFDHGLSIACVVAGLVAIAGTLLAAVFLPAQPPQQPGHADLPAHRVPDQTRAARTL
ncbi:EmrB/QacA subfamily drug resistance transporter [Streptomyces sp. SAI-117]|uniref:MFS transporter n=1 Tax=unclassified Streptomyces TaxID=2593676 RepID=UPI00247400F9|nr:MULTISPECIES: MFS transporter [unclassified Streptomyces]MDH6553969.1 EmrB/QacA subfamily drug resistance transporter [Streptomyces sp. SAI-041]MDH6573047.1 EmrB/QacA subfamily drug resistance transporter [Streptomyces sp. SAI-117]MDH6581991.1 EmrB/QacA subfamily drug resistance transporter [Streptomyces sp. SAI-133]